MLSGRMSSLRGESQRRLTTHKCWTSASECVSTNPSARHRRPFSLRPGSSGEADVGCGSPKPVSSHAPQTAGRRRTYSFSGLAGQPCGSCLGFKLVCCAVCRCWTKSDSSTDGRPCEVYRIHLSFAGLTFRSFCGSAAIRKRFFPRKFRPVWQRV